MKFVISLGGSLIYPKRIDWAFIKDFTKLIKKHSKNNQFVIICGGGRLARNLQEKAPKGATQQDLDWLGIYATRANALALSKAFKLKERVITDPTIKIQSKSSIIIAAGWKPGWSTDYDAVLLAKNIGATAVINMSNIDYAYNKDPKKHKDAKPIKQTTWKSFRKLVGSKWSPGLNMPFDPIASKQAEKSKLKVIIVGKDLKNLENVLQNKKFMGTIIS